MEFKEKIIEVVNLKKNFGDFVAVDDISFSVNKGEIFAFLGPNGAGKSTTIKILTTILNPTEGKVIINNFSLSEDKINIRRSFGIVFQDPSLDDELTARENLEFHARLYNISKKVYKSRIEELLKFVDLLDRQDSLVKTFSGGMKRRLEIARGLIHHPKILFLDEPTVGLDPQTRNNLWEYISEVNKKERMTIFLTTHYMEEAEKISDIICIMDHGKILMIDTPKNILEKTQTKDLEEAFLSLTGRNIREELVSNNNRTRHNLWHRK